MNESTYIYRAGYETSVQCSSTLLEGIEELISDRYEKKINDAVNSEVDRLFNDEKKKKHDDLDKQLKALQDELAKLDEEEKKLTEKPPKFYAPPEDKYTKASDVTGDTPSDTAYKETLGDIKKVHMEIGSDIERLKYTPESTGNVRPSSETIQKMIDVENQIHTTSVNDYVNVGGYNGENVTNVADLMLNSYEYREDTGTSYFYRYNGGSPKALEGDLGNMSFEGKDETSSETSETLETPNGKEVVHTSVYIDFVFPVRFMGRIYNISRQVYVGLAE